MCIGVFFISGTYRFTGAPWKLNQQARRAAVGPGLPACLRSSSAAGSVAEASSASSSTAASSTATSLLDELVAPAVKAGAYVEAAAHDPPDVGADAAALVPPMPSTRGCRIKAAPPAKSPPPLSADASTGQYERFAWESSRQRQWRLYGVWRCRGGRRQDEFKAKRG